MNAVTDADTAMSTYLRDTYQELNSRADQFNLRAKEIEASRPDVADIGGGWRALADEAAKAMREIEAMYPEITGAIQ